MSTRDDAWLAIVNPASGRSRGDRGWRGLESALRRASVPVEFRYTAGPHEGEEIARAAVVAGRRRLLAVGGDGSVHDVVNGIQRAADGAAPADLLLAVAPSGTANDWARGLGIEREPRAIAAMLAAGRVLRHDVGRVDFATGPRGPHGRWFINVAGAGFDAYVLARLPAQVPSGYAYLREALRSLRGYRAPRLRIEAGDAVLEDRMLLAFVANGRYCGNRMLVAPTARVDDGLLEVVAVREVGLAAALLRLGKLYSGSLLDDPVVRHLRAGSVRISADTTVPVEADGQVVGTTPAAFSLRPGALGVVVP